MDREATQKAPAALERWAVVAAAAVLAGTVLAGAASGPLPTHDGPQHVWALHVANHLDDPQRGWSDWLEPTLPVTSLGFAALFGTLDLALPWPTALRVAVPAMALLWGVCVLALARALHPARVWLGLALAGAAYGWILYMGLFAFHIATSAGLAVVAWAVARRPSAPREVAVLAALVGVLALLHVVSAFLTGLVLAALLWSGAEPGGRRAAGLRIAAVALPGAVIAAALLSPGADLLAWHPRQSDSSFEPAPWWILGKCFAGGPPWRAWPLTVLALAAPVIALAGGWRRCRPADRALLTAGGLLLVCAAVAPLDVPTWEFFAPRFLPLGIAALVLSLPLERLAPRHRAVAGAALAGFGLAATAWAGVYNRALAERAAPALAGLEAPIVRHGLRLPIVFDPGAGAPLDPAEAAMPWALPLVNLGQLYAATQGGLTPYGFAVNPLAHHVVVREDAAARAPAPVGRSYVADLTRTPRGRDPAFRAALLTDLASRSTRFEDVIFYGRPEEADRLRDLGFVEDWRSGGLSIAHFAGCPFALHLSPEAARRATEGFEIGWFPSWHAAARYRPTDAAARGDGSRTLRLRQTCGALWLRPLAADFACEGADAEGRLLVASTRETPERVCRLAGEAWTGPPGADLAHR